MSEIPEDVRVAANMIFNGSMLCGGFEAFEPSDIYRMLEKAILAERKRCAGTANGWADDDLQKAETRLVAAYIIRAINSGSQP